ncbi:hypothetical protein RMSM_01491 [Rhodopirellula maiorica SM1]|uniref:Uncharacterized protein n=2 Tax=Novipirellula TaxID=2795426 RepID=M5RQT2_9BACT|nr:hypothetical protein RMSM_01491 [Rhodopirellula maiorica SM1]
MQIGNEIGLLDMIATLRARSRTSFMFDLGTKGDTLTFPDTGEVFDAGPGRVYNVFGWIDVHYPCEGSHPLQVRMGLPDDRVSWETMRDTIAELRNYFDIPDDAGYQIYLTGLTAQTSMEHPITGFVSTR